jgi:hypothetical protein
MTEILASSFLVGEMSSSFSFKERILYYAQLPGKLSKPSIIRETTSPAHFIALSIWYGYL